MPVAFEVYMQNQNTGMWEAVTINPAGRVREWRYDASNSVWNSLD